MTESALGTGTILTSGGTDAINSMLSRLPNSSAWGTQTDNTGGYVDILNLTGGGHLEYLWWISPLNVDGFLKIITDASTTRYYYLRSNTYGYATYPSQLSSEASARAGPNNEQADLGTMPTALSNRLVLPYYFTTSLRVQVRRDVGASAVQAWAGAVFA